MGLGTVIAAATFALVLFRVNPETAGLLSFALFYLSLFLTVTGLISIVSFLVRVVARREELLSRLVALSFRQAVLFALLAVSALALHSRHLLSWWNALFLVAAVTLVEFFFLSLGRQPLVDRPAAE